MAKKFNPAPGWPEPPQGWLPHDGWRPDPTWPPAPEGWQIVTDDSDILPATNRPGVSRLEPLVPHQARQLTATALPRDPEALWEGVGNPIGGWNPGRYKLTRTMLFFERGVLTTNGQQIPIINIIDVDVRQSILQKSRNVGSVLVHVVHNGTRELVTIEDIEDYRHLMTLINGAVRDARIAAHELASTSRVVSNSTHLVAQVWPGSAHEGSQTHEAVVDPIEQLSQLGKLHQAGVLTEEEFSAKKAEILSRL